jgi:DNA-binding IscR family transcriptional regulator
MQASERFATSVELLLRLAAARPGAVTSADLAAASGTNAVVIRRLIVRLNAAGITSARMGKGGDATLARAVRKVTLRDIYEAVESRTPRPKGSPAIDALWAEIEAAESAFLKVLEETTLKQFAKAAQD